MLKDSQFIKLTSHAYNCKTLRQILPSTKSTRDLWFIKCQWKSRQKYELNN